MNKHLLLDLIENSYSAYYIRDLQRVEIKCKKCNIHFYNPNILKIQEFYDIHKSECRIYDNKEEIEMEFLTCLRYD